MGENCEGNVKKEDTMEQHHRGHWGSNLGFLMATIGAAVGLGNIWAFPYKMGMNGGFAFLLVYLVMAIMVGFPIMLTELAIGRKVGGSVLVSYQTVGGKFGTFIGGLAMLSSFLILSFYTVLGAYCVEYVCLNFAELLGIFKLSSISGAQSFADMLTNQGLAVLFTCLVIAACFLIIRGGIKDGIEKFNKVGMPALAIMLVIVIIRAVTLPGAADGIKFMLTPNFEPLKTNFLGVLSAAGGQVFFSLSLAMGITVTYGSYLRKEESLVKNSLIIIISDTCVAFMAGLAVLPAAFALGGENAELAGPKLLFITLQDVFNSMGSFGPVFGILFYLFVTLAAITSTIALIEVLVTFAIDHRRKQGKQSNRTVVVLVICLIVMAEAALVAADGLGSNGLWIPFQGSGWYFSGSWLDFMDFISEGVAMPVGALLMIFLVWKIRPSTIREEATAAGRIYPSSLYTFYRFCIYVAAPLGMLMVLIGQLQTFLAPLS